ncbi:SRPBCC family protein [Bacillus horti]|uniref:Uncharacterized protein YndB with AHSA1/START domain n=1 Tax=Caldalkalibacillus horti TaxID=77523 RepID=A0ABT9VZA2_9BACI|nr:SRPBCC family protein [Bacillus horti]MDQ0166327.1 uncharacterized protein YndB with AHSA1/START domain [Bacillus horti]
MSTNRYGLDLEKCLGAVTRTVTDIVKEGVQSRNVQLERSYDTSANDLWDAVTNQERLKRWFMPVSGELKLGGQYQLEGNAHGTITKCKPQQFFAATWEFGGEVSWIEVRVTPLEDEKARLTLSHICPLNDHWEQYGPAAAGIGWDLAFIGLEVHLSDVFSDSFNEEAFATSAEGNTYIVNVSVDWGRAAIKAGEEPEQATAAAQRTAAFFTGEESQEG